MTEFSTSKTTRTRKVKLFKFKKIPTQPTRNGRLSISIKLERKKLKDSTKNLVSTEIDHST
jgi:hypothetical protein